MAAYERAGHLKGRASSGRLTDLAITGTVFAVRGYASPPAGSRLLPHHGFPTHLANFYHLLLPCAPLSYFQRYPEISTGWVSDLRTAGPGWRGNEGQKTL